jgi:hypothetical protein
MQPKNFDKTKVTKEARKLLEQGKKEKYTDAAGYEKFRIKYLFKENNE